MSTPDVITTREAASRFGIRTARIRKWASKGLIEAVGSSPRLYCAERIAFLVAVDGHATKTPLEVALEKYNNAIEVHLKHKTSESLDVVPCGSSCPELAGGVCDAYRKEVIPLFKNWHRLLKGEMHGTDRR